MGNLLCFDFELGLLVIYCGFVFGLFVLLYLDWCFWVLW